MDITSLEKLLQKKVKVTGDKASALSDAVTIARNKNKITVFFESPFSKQYLKYLMKKYLNKHNVQDWFQVIASNKDCSI